MISGVTRTLDLPITLDQILAWNAGKVVQAAFPNLTASQREFLMTGSTDEEWDKAFGADSAIQARRRLRQENRSKSVDYEEVTRLLRREW